MALGKGLDALWGDTTLQDQAGGSVTIPVAQIEPGLNQPRKHFDEEALAGLAESIRQHGIIQPLTVRRLSSGYYQIIAGERRWRAARMAGLAEVPAIVIEADDRMVMELGLIENLQRRDLDFWEEAKALERLTTVYGLSQEEAAAKVGKSQSAVANKLRLLRLSPDCVRLLREHDLSERHARALLRLTDEEDRLKALQVIAARGYNVAQSEAHIEELLKLKQKTPPQRLPTYIVKDVRIFVNTIDHAIRLMTDNGVPATAHREERDGYIEYTVRIPTAAAQR